MLGGQFKEGVARRSPDRVTPLALRPTQSVVSCAARHRDCRHCPPAKRGPPLAETLTDMNGLVEEGSVRHTGVSNFGSRLLGGACRLSDAPIFANQAQPHRPRTCGACTAATTCC